MKHGPEVRVHIDMGYSCRAENENGPFNMMRCTYKQQTRIQNRQQNSTDS